MGKRPVSYIVDSKGKRTAVILPIKVYKQLLEEIHDLAVIVASKDANAADLRKTMESSRSSERRARKKIAH